MTVELTASVENALKAFNEYKGMVEGFDKKLNDIAPKLDAFDKEKLSKFEKSIGDALEESQKAAARQKALEDDLAAVKTAMNRPGAPETKADVKETRAKFKKAINAFARMDSGRREVYFDDFVKEAFPQDAELKALSVGSNPDGGYVSSTEMGGIVQAKVYESSPMRMLASSITIGKLEYEFVIDNDEAGSGWVGETASRSTTSSPTFGKQLIPTHELYANPKATQTVLDDADIDIEAWLSAKIGEKFGRDEATAFVTGSGIGKPRGFMAYTSGTNIAAEQIEQVVSGSASTLTFDGLIGLQNALKEPYQRNASFVFRRATNLILMGIKDGTGHPIFNMGFDKNAGLQPTLLGQPAYFAADVAAVASNALALAYGDFKQAYLIVDRIGIRMLRDPYTDKPYIAFYTTKRVGGAVTNYEAIKIQKVST